MNRPQPTSAAESPSTDTGAIASSRRTTSGALHPTFRASRSKSSRANTASPKSDDRQARLERESARTESRGFGRPSPTQSPDVTRYPDGNGFALKTALAARFGVRREQVVLGNGSNDILELATQAFLRPGDEAVYSQHAFAVYPLATQARGASGVAVPARDLGHDLDGDARRDHAAHAHRVRRQSEQSDRHLACPGCGEALRLHRCRTDVLVVLDEAYNEYLPSPHSRRTPRPGSRDHPNLLISRTFSKAYGLAGLRVGYGLMNARVADMLNRVRQPFNVNSVAQAAALAALADADYVAEERASQLAPDSRS